jgi:hypothetical protein
LLIASFFAVAIDCRFLMIGLLTVFQFKQRCTKMALDPSFTGRFETHNMFGTHDVAPTLSHTMPRSPRQLWGEHPIPGAIWTTEQ